MVPYVSYLVRYFSDLEERLRICAEGPSAKPRTDNYNWFNFGSIRELFDSSLDVMIGDNGKQVASQPIKAVALTNPFQTAKQVNSYLQHPSLTVSSYPTNPVSFGYENTQGGYQRPQTSYSQTQNGLETYQIQSSPSDSDSFHYANEYQTLLYQLNTQEQSKQQINKTDSQMEISSQMNGEEDLGFGNSSLSKNKKQKEEKKEEKKEETKKKEEKGEESEAQQEKPAGFFGKIFDMLGLKKLPTQVHLPDEQNAPLKWDPVSKKWYSGNAPPSKQSLLPPPPPTLNFSKGTEINSITEKTQHKSNFSHTSFPSQNAQFSFSSTNPYSSTPVKKVTRSRYVDVMSQIK